LRRRQIVNCEITVENAPTPAKQRSAAKVHYQVIVKPLEESAYHTAGFIAIAINLTPVMQEQQERERYESLFRFASDSSQIGVVFYDIHTAVGMATQSWCSTMNETFVSGTFPAYTNVAPEDREVLLAYQQEVRNGEVPEPLYREIRVTDKEGKVHWVRQHIYVVPKSARLIELSLNIDQQKQSEQALEEARKHAEQSNIETQLFLEEISHEVRTPLNSIVGFSAILAELDDEGCKQEFAPIIRKNVQLLDELLTNILDLSALDAGTVRFRPEWFSVPELFRELEETIRNNRYGKRLQAIVHLPDSVDEWLIHADRKYLNLLLLNLVSNAAKFTPDGGQITLNYHRDERKCYCFSVTDTGCGITPDKLQHIFDRFYKVDTFIQGTGLGLPLCRSIAEHLGGKIEVDSTPGEGSTFSVELPE
jgi:signal transduction histidine kinase